MQNPFIGQINIVGFNFPPRGWAFCDGQLMAISSNDALFSLLGTIYGGDGRTSFGLPDLRGRVMRHLGTGPGLTPQRIGAKGGVESVNMTINQMPAHNHIHRASTKDATLTNPSGAVFGTKTDINDFEVGDQPDTVMNSSAITATGGAQAFPVMDPFLSLYHVIALVGIYPSRT